MARKKVLLHIGPGPRDTAWLDADHTPAHHDALAEQAALLERAGLGVLDLDPDDVEHASLEMLREHACAGLRRRDVEGSWAWICRKAHKAKRDLVVSQERFHAADEAQVPLILDSLMGLETHVVLTVGGDDDTDVISQAWRASVKKARFHVVTLADGATPADLAEALVGVALSIRARELDKKITKLHKRRKKVRKELRLREAS